MESQQQCTGRRNGARVGREIDLVAESHDRRYLVGSINISRSGILLGVRDRALLRHVDPAGLAGADGRIRKKLRWGIMLRFGHFRCRAIVVRVVPGDVIQLGCRFCIRLPHMMCNTLRVPDTDDVDA